MTSPALTVVVTEDRQQWAGRITAAWQKSLPAIFETGRLIIDARQRLPHGEFLAMVRADLPFSISTAERLAKIAANIILANSEFAPNLPTSWDVLYQLTKLEPRALLEKLRDGSIHPRIGKRDVSTWRAQMPHPEAPMENPNVNRANGGNTLTLPSGQTVESLCRMGIELEQQGMPPDNAARRVGMGLLSYRRARDLTQLASRDDLRAEDKETVTRALAIMNDTKQIKAAYAMVRKIAERMWGTKRSRNERSIERRLESFKTALTIIVEACTRGRDLDVPHLSSAEARIAIEQVGEASIALRSLAAKIKGGTA